MTTAQLNVRLDENLKAGGDAVLQRFGVSAVQVVRDVWQYMVDYQRVPTFGEHPAMRGLRRDDCIALAEEGAGMATRLAREAGISVGFEAMTYEELREAAYEEMLVEQDERHA